MCVEFAFSMCSVTPSAGWKKCPPSLSASLPHAIHQIIPVIRSEGSGTTAVWSAAISDSVPIWKEARGSFFTWNASWIGTNWMVGGASIDVASLVRTVSDSIAYVSYSYAAAFGLPFASIGQPSEPPIPVVSVGFFLWLSWLFFSLSSTKSYRMHGPCKR